MAASNIIIHLLALAVVLGLAWWQLTLLKERQFIRQLLVSTQRKTVGFDWQQRFIGKFCRAFAIPLGCQEIRKEDSLQAIRGDVLLRLVWTYSVTAMVLSSPEGSLLLTISAGGVENPRLWEQELTQTLSLRVIVVTI